MPSSAAIAVSTRIPVTLPTSESAPTTTEPWRICRFVGMVSAPASAGLVEIPRSRLGESAASKGNGNHKQEKHQDRRGSKIEFEESFRGEGEPARDGRLHDPGRRPLACRGLAAELDQPPKNPRHHPDPRRHAPEAALRAQLQKVVVKVLVIAHFRALSWWQIERVFALDVIWADAEPGMRANHP